MNPAPSVVFVQLYNDDDGYRGNNSTLLLLSAIKLPNGYFVEGVHTVRTNQQSVPVAIHDSAQNEFTGNCILKIILAIEMIDNIVILPI